MWFWEFFNIFRHFSALLSSTFSIYNKCDFENFPPFKKKNIKNTLIIGQKSRKIGDNKARFELKIAYIQVFQGKQNQNHISYRSKKSKKYSIIMRKMPKYIKKNSQNQNYYRPKKSKDFLIIRRCLIKTSIKSCLIIEYFFDFLSSW